MNINTIIWLLSIIINANLIANKEISLADIIKDISNINIKMNLPIRNLIKFVNKVDEDAEYNLKNLNKIYDSLSNLCSQDISNMESYKNDLKEYISLNEISLTNHVNELESNTNLLEINKQKLKIENEEIKNNIEKHKNQDIKFIQGKKEVKEKIQVIEECISIINENKNSKNFSLTEFGLKEKLNSISKHVLDARSDILNYSLISNFLNLKKDELNENLILKLLNLLKQLFNKFNNTKNELKATYQTSKENLEKIKKSKLESLDILKDNISNEEEQINFHREKISKLNSIISQLKEMYIKVNNQNYPEFYCSTLLVKIKQEKEEIQQVRDSVKDIIVSRI